MRSQRRDESLQIRRAGHFQLYIKATDIVVDFGCGTGGVLANIKCAKKIGVEVNELSINEAKKYDFEIVPDTQEIESDSVDVVISNHALEHVISPANQILEFKRLLKRGGKIILVVPAESPFNKKFLKWEKKDPDQHIYSWTPLSFGNLISQCGFEIEKSIYRPIGYSKINAPLAKINEPLFQFSRHFIAFIFKRYEIVCIAYKP